MKENSKTATEVITKLQHDYLEPLTRWSLGELAEKFDGKMENAEDLREFAEKFETSIFQQLFQQDTFLDLPIMEHFVDQVACTHYFAIDVIENEYYKASDRLAFQTFFVGENGHGFAGILASAYSIAGKEYYQTIRDILPLLEKYTDILDMTLHYLRSAETLEDTSN